MFVCALSIKSIRTCNNNNYIDEQNKVRNSFSPIASIRTCQGVYCPHSLGFEWVKIAAFGLVERLLASLPFRLRLRTKKNSCQSTFFPPPRNTEKLVMKIRNAVVMFCTGWPRMRARSVRHEKCVRQTDNNKKQQKKPPRRLKSSEIWTWIYCFHHCYFDKWTSKQKNVAAYRQSRRVHFKWEKDLLVMHRYDSETNDIGNRVPGMRPALHAKTATARKERRPQHKHDNDDKNNNNNKINKKKKATTTTTKRPRQLQPWPRPRRTHGSPSRCVCPPHRP